MPRGIPNKPKAVEEAKVVKETIKAPKKTVSKPIKISSKLITEPKIVCKDEFGKGGKTVEGIVSLDGKSITTLKGVTYAL